MMLKSLMYYIIGIIFVIFYFLNIVLWVILILILLVFKFIFICFWWCFILYLLDVCVMVWIGVNNVN